MNAGNFGGEAHAAGAGNAARHLGGDQRPQIQIFRGAFRLAVSAEIDTVGHGLILQVTFTTLIADRAIQGVIYQKKFHHALTGLFDHGRGGLYNRRFPIGTGAQVADLHGAAGGGFGRAALNLNQTHPAIASDGQTFVIAKARNFHPGHFGGLNDGHRAIHFDFDAVDADLLEVGHLSLRSVPRCIPQNGRSIAVCFIPVQLWNGLGGKPVPCQ